MSPTGLSTDLGSPPNSTSLVAHNPQTVLDTGYTFQLQLKVFCRSSLVHVLGSFWGHFRVRWGLKGVPHHWAWTLMLVALQYLAAAAVLVCAGPVRLSDSRLAKSAILASVTHCNCIATLMRCVDHPEAMKFEICTAKPYRPIPVIASNHRQTWGCRQLS